jgi:hypothetical protein
MVDFGQVRKGDSKTHVFLFSNTGTVPVEIDLITSCECTTLTWDEGRIFEPGASGVLKVVFDSSEKEESETVDIDVILTNVHPETGYPIVYTLQYKYELID